MAGKKRKAGAKKKHKNQSNNTSSSSTPSNEKLVDNVKHQDDNVGASQNQRSTLTDGNKEAAKNGESVVQTDGGVIIKDAYIEVSTSNNSASSSDDELRGITNNPSVEDYSAAVNPVEATGLLSETRVDEITEVKSSSGDKVGISEPKECDVQEKDDRLTTSYGASNVRVNNGAEGVTQPLLERPLKTTSWKSCCGLYELFTGSTS